jgi:four helix bundle protein
MDEGIWRFDAFRRAYDLSLVLHRASLGWPKVEQYGGVADQLRRASKSVCALLVEGQGRRAQSKVEYRRYLMMAVGSADEAGLWCRYAADLGYAATEEAEAWQAELSEIAQMLQALRGRLSAP